MSSILKALKKLDAEKHSKTGAGPDLSNTQESPATQQRSWLPLLAGVVLGVLSVGVLMVWFEKPVVLQQQKAATKQSTTVTSLAAQPAAPVEVVTSPKSVETPPRPASQAMSVPTEKISARPQPASPTRPAEDAAVTRVKPAQVQKEQKPASSPPVAAAPPAPIATPVAAPAAAAAERQAPLIGLKVSEIFFNEDGTDSMAVVNDLPVMEGTLIEGAVVEQILADRVVFLLNGQTLEILPTAEGQ